MKEKELSIALGLSRDFMKEIRTSYVEGEDWTRIESNKPKVLWEVQWTLDGVNKLRSNLGMKESVLMPKVKEGVVSGKYSNTRMLKVLIDGKDESVICRDNTKFIKGMKVNIRWDGIRWCISRHPRFNGKY